MLWCMLGIVAGILFGIIPGAGPFLAIATFYSVLVSQDPFHIMLFYVSLLITTNYTNSVTGILYGIPGDPAAVTTARHGHKMFLEGKGHYAVSSNAISSTIGSLFAVGLFFLFLSSIFVIFKFYNSTIQLIIIIAAILFLLFLSPQAKWKTFLMFILGGVLGKIGFDNLTFKTWGTFGIDYLTLGIPFSAIMIGLYIVPEVLKFHDKEFIESKVTGFGYDHKTLPSTLMGSFVGFWCGLVPGVTNVLGSYLSSNFVSKDVNKIAAAEAANNSGALSSLLPLLLLGIPIVGSEVLVFYIMSSKGFRFDISNLHIFTDILYYIPFVLVTCLVLSWACFNQLGNIAQLYKRYKYVLTCGILAFIIAMSIYIYPVKFYMIICILILSAAGFVLRKLDTFPIIYGFFLTDLFWNNLIRVIAIHT